MKILIAYSSNSGSTFEVGELLAQILGQHHEVTFKRASDTNANDFYNYSGIILGSGSWNSGGAEGMPEPSMIKLVEGARDKKFEQWFAIYGCGDSSYTKFCGAVDYLEKFVRSIQGKQLVESLRIDSFFFDLKNNVELADAWARHLVKKLT